MERRISKLLFTINVILLGTLSCRKEQLSINLIPKADAGIDQIIYLPINRVQLTGSGVDIDGTITGYEWRKTHGPSSYFIENESVAQTGVKELEEGEYLFALKVTDNKGASSIDYVKVIVQRVTNDPCLGCWDYQLNAI